MKSTVPVGTGAAIQRARAQRPDARATCPTRSSCKEGSAVDDFMQPDRVVVGADGD